MSSSARPLVLAITGHDDPMWPFLQEATEPSDIFDVLLFPTDQPDVATCSYDPVASHIMFHWADGRTVHGEQIAGVWWRRLVPVVNPTFSEALSRYCAGEFETFLEGLEHCLAHALWISKPSAIQRARSKSLQLRLARQLGFECPATVFTNTPVDLLSACAGKSVYKAIRTHRVPVGPTGMSLVFTTRLTEAHLSVADGLKYCPGIVQAFCDKAADIRVTVFGESCFAVHIDSQSCEWSRVDFRYRAREVPHRVYELPCALERQCVALVRALGLEFGAIDLALTHDGRYVFFEINPNGQWGWLEERVGLPMRRAMLGMFARHCRALKGA